MTRHAAALAGALAAALVAVSAACAQPLRFAALGDQPYGQDARTGPAYRKLIDLINGERVAFSIHVGDFKRGWAECSDELYEQQASYFDRFESALIYTPGDNDWSDCGLRGADPLQRLQALRDRFFVAPRSLGQHPLPTQRQAELQPEHVAYRENQRWWVQGVLFVTLHTLGPSDNADAEAPDLLAEHRRRLAANIAWLREAFAHARQGDARALVLATQADPLRRPKRRLGPPVVHKSFRQLFDGTLLPLSQGASVPVLLVHGDSHEFVTDRPFRDSGGRRIDNLWRLQVPGDMRMHAVLVTVDAAKAQPFDFRLLWNPLSPDPH